jgi:hypothetical protein
MEEALFDLAALASGAKEQRRWPLARAVVAHD